jgi:apolipoprotein N-acyltransferase
MPLIAWVFGLGKYAVGVSWIYVSIHQYGGASLLLAGAMVAVFVAFMALFCLPIGWFLGKLKASNQHISKSALAMGFVATWVLMEWMLTWFLTGFPWLFAGHAMLGTPLQGYAPCHWHLRAQPSGFNHNRSRHAQRRSGSDLESTYRYGRSSSSAGGPGHQS